MSSDGVGWVIRHSPLKGVGYTVHLCIGDSANDQHDQEFWMSLTHLAQKARCSRRAAYGAIRELLEMGCLDELESPLGGDGKPTGKPGRYRFLFPDMPVVFENRKRSGGRQPLQPPLQPLPGGQATTASEVGNQFPLSQENTTNPSASSEQSAVVEEEHVPTDVGWAALADIKARLHGETDGIKQAETVELPDKPDTLVEAR